MCMHMSAYRVAAWIYTVLCVWPLEPSSGSSQTFPFKCDVISYQTKRLHNNMKNVKIKKSASFLFIVFRNSLTSANIFTFK